MKRAKYFLVVLAMMMTSVFYAEPSERLIDLNSLSAEIEQILRDYEGGLENGTTVTVFFSISEDRTIQCVNVATSDPDLDCLVQKKLEGRLLYGKKWNKGKIYELSINYPKSPVYCSKF
ncbi:MAG: hypothetical protein WBL21_13955 [Salinimicrobium sp.]